MLHLLRYYCYFYVLCFIEKNPVKLFEDPTSIVSVCACMCVSVCLHTHDHVHCMHKHAYFMYEHWLHVSFWCPLSRNFSVRDQTLPCLCWAHIARRDHTILSSVRNLVSLSRSIYSEGVCTTTTCVSKLALVRAHTLTHSHTQKYLIAQWHEFTHILHVTHTQVDCMMVVYWTWWS